MCLFAGTDTSGMRRSSSDMSEPARTSSSPKMPGSDQNQKKTTGLPYVMGIITVPEGGMWVIAEDRRLLLPPGEKMVIVSSSSPNVAWASGELDKRKIGSERQSANSRLSLVDLLRSGIIPV